MNDESLKAILRRLLRVKMELTEQGEPVPNELEDEIQRVVLTIAERFASEMEAEENRPDSE